jgi:hypothetical protein
MSSTREQLFDLIDNRAEFRSITEVAVDSDGGDLIVLGWGPLTFLVFVDGVDGIGEGANTRRLQVELRGFSGQEQTTETIVARSEVHEIA